MNARTITILTTVLGTCWGITVPGCGANATGESRELTAFDSRQAPVARSPIFPPLENREASREGLREVSAQEMKDYPITAVSFTSVKLADEFWAPRIETNRTVTIPYAFKKCEETGRIDNFAIAGGLATGKHRGNYPFDDTDVYKVLEGAAYSLAVHPDPKLDKFLQEVISKIAAAQEDDGYLYTCRTNKCERLKNWYGDKRWSKLASSHELYNMGHLYEAAVAHWQATGKQNLLHVAVKNADFLCEVFGPGKLEKAPGHQIIEMGLARLYRATAEQRYLKLAKFFLDRRGGETEYNQSHKKVIDQTQAVGHAVRATYMYCGMADVAALTGEKSYQKAIDRIWQDVATRKLYLTGGIGATARGEAFGQAYELPNETAYCETCAAIGNVMWNHRMFLTHADAKYIDVLERTLYNALLSGVSLDGKQFFYSNPLQSHGQHKRSPWFACACCPGNITRFIASVPGYVYARTDDTIYVNLFVAGSATIRTGSNTVGLQQQTRYPWDGLVKMAIQPQRPARFTICVRIPGWAQNRPVPGDLYHYVNNTSTEKVTLKLNGQQIPLNMQRGFACIRRKWKKGDVIELNLPMPIRRIVAHQNVQADRGKVALQRGPIVYCAEWPDNDGQVLNLLLPDDAKLTSQHRKDMLNAVTVIRGRAVGLSYDKKGSIVKKQRNLMAIPYYAWAHRGAGEMAVWLARDESAAQPLTPPGVISNPSFEKAVGDKPAGWQKRTYGGKGQFRYLQDGRTPNRCVMLASDSGADLGWLTTVPVKPNCRYRLSGWVKTENVIAGSGKGALLNLHNIQPLQSPALTGTNDWTQLELIFDTKNNTVVQINCLFGGWGQSTGRAWYDDVTLQLIRPETLNPTVKIDVTKTGEPVSKYIYGQFIEHLGRCIYGGIWAEMLQDRKFYHPVGSAESPWKPLDNSSIIMDKTDPFVGDHSPEISVPGGITQAGLGLIQGKDYTGRIWLKAARELQAVDVTLRWGQNHNEGQTITIKSLGADYIKAPLRFKAGATTDNARLEIAARGNGTFHIGTVSLMPADNIKGMRADTLKLLKELNAPIYRWPGGNFVSGYDWRWGIGPRDRRPPVKNPAWKGIEHNDFGLDEFIIFCREVGAEPMITVNSGFGDDHSAAQEVQYANGSTHTPMGKWRAENGHPEPYNVRFWCIGNEMYGSWQLGHMSIKHYVRKHNLFAKAMRSADPSIQLIAVGSVGSWSEEMLKNCADYMDLISEHFYRGAKKSLLQHVRQAPEAVRRIVTAHRDYRKRLSCLRAKDIRIAIDEWNYWYGEHIFGELGTRYFLRDALGIAEGLHEMIRNSDLVFMANYAQTVNVIGAIKTTKTAAAFETTGLVLRLYRNHFAQLPVKVTHQAYPLDIVAALTEDRKALTIAIVNPTEDRHHLGIDLKGISITGSGQLYVISHPNPLAYNEPGKKPRVVIEKKPLAGISDTLTIPPLSINLYKLATSN